MIKPQSWLMALLVATSVGTIAQPAAATIVLDQSNVPDALTSFHVFQARSIDYQGQSFTAGLNGTLANIRLDIGNYNVPPVDINFYLAPIVGGTIKFSNAYELTIPSSSVTANGAGQGPSVADWLSIDFSPFNIAVHAGDQFALVFHSPISFEDTGGINAHQINWFADVPGRYDGGLMVDSGMTLQDSPIGSGNGADALFQTFVNVSAVPEPSTWAMFLIGFGLIGAALRARKGLPILQCSRLTVAGFEGERVRG